MPPWTSSDVIVDALLPVCVKLPPLTVIAPAVNAFVPTFTVPPETEKLPDTFVVPLRVVEELPPVWEKLPTEKTKPVAVVKLVTEVVPVTVTAFVTVKSPVAVQDPPSWIPSELIVPVTFAEGYLGRLPGITTSSPDCGALSLGVQLLRSVHELETDPFQVLVRVQA